MFSDIKVLYVCQEKNNFCFLGSCRYGLRSGSEVFRSSSVFRKVSEVQQFQKCRRFDVLEVQWFSGKFQKLSSFRNSEVSWKFLKFSRFRSFKNFRSSEIFREVLEAQQFQKFGSLQLLLVALRGFRDVCALKV